MRNKEEIKIISVLNSEAQHPSFWNDYEAGRFKFASYEIFLDADINHIDRQFATMLDVVKESGAIEHGFFFICSLFLTGYQKYNRDKVVAQSMIQERR